MRYDCSIKLAAFQSVAPKKFIQKFVQIEIYSNPEI